MSELQTLRRLFTDGMSMSPDELWAIDFAAAVILSSKSHKNVEPLFGCVIGPPSTGKTELLRPYFNWDGMTTNLNEVTQNGLVSGAPNVARTFLQTLHRRVMVIPDLTPMLQSSQQRKEQFFGVIRAIFDGAYDKASGAAGSNRRIEARVSILAASTEIISTYAESDIDMGQRFVFIRSVRHRTRARQRAISRLALESIDTPTWRASVQSTVHRLFDTVKRRHSPATPPNITVQTAVGPKRDDESEADYRARVSTTEREFATGWHWVELPRVSISDAHTESLISLAAILTRARSGRFDASHCFHEEEGYTRFQKQLQVVTRQRAILDQRDAFNDEDLEFARMITRDTLDPFRYRLLAVLERVSSPASTGLTVDEIAASTRIPPNALSNILAHYNYNGVVEKVGSPACYKLHPDMMEDLTLCKLTSSMTTST